MSDYTEFNVDPKIYPFPVFVFFGSKKKLLKSLKGTIPEKEWKWIKSIEFHKGKSIRTKNGYRIIWLRKTPDTVFWKGALAHEIFHMVCDIMETAEVVFSDQSEEAFAYLMQFFTTEVYSNLD